jgi:hypothetical protein
MAQLRRNLSNQEKEYFSERENWIKTLKPETLADFPFLFQSRQNINEILGRIDLFRKVLGVTGDIIECGVAQGNGLMIYAHLSAMLEPYALNRHIVGFDTFEGFRSISSGNDPDDISNADFSFASDELLAKAIEIYDMGRPMNHVPRVSYVKGDAVQTIPQYVKDHPELIIAMLYLDFDIYEPTKVALDHFLPLVPKGGIVAFDEINYAKFAGETIALKEKLNLNGVKLERIPYAPFVGYFVV